MYRPERQPAWQTNLVWASAILVMIATVCSVAIWPFARLASEKHGPTLLHIAVTHILPQHGGGTLVQAAADIAPGQPFALVTGAEIVFTPEQAEQLNPQTAIEAGALALTNALFAAGEEATLALVHRSSLAAPISRALVGPLPALLASTLGEELFAAGLAANNRLADWRAQQAANPGASVQPLVGVFVQVPPEQLEGLTAADIGTVVVRQLTQVLVAGGQDAARELLSNEQHIAAFDVGAAHARQRATDLFTVLLYASETEVHERLVAARAFSAGAGQAVPTGGLVSERELAQLSASEQYTLITKRIADEVYASGTERAAAQLSDPADQQAVIAAGPLLELFTQAAHDRYSRLERIAWLTGALLVLVIALNTRRYWRLVLPALLIGLGIVPHFIALGALSELPSTVLWQPLAVSALREGMLVTAYVGAGLLGLQVLISLVQLVRPQRRRRYL